MTKCENWNRSDTRSLLLTRRDFSVAAAAGFGSFCAGCAVNPATGDQQVMLMSADQERRIGAEEHPKILKEFGGAYEDPKLSGYIAAIGGRLAAASELPDMRVTITVLNSPIVNAMALPGGYVYVTRGLLALAQNEAEVAGVIGHEIGHVVARHTAARLSRAQVAQFGLIGLAVLGSATGLPAGTGRLASTLASLHLQGFSREQEFEADTLGIRYMSRVGYDPEAMATFLSVVFTYSQLPQKIIQYFTEIGVGIYFFWTALAIICLVLGTFIEIVPVFYLTVPIFAAIIISLNQNLLHLYVVFVAFAGIGMITPPVCVGVYTAAGVIREDPARAFKEVPLFVGVGLLYGILMILFPAAATWLPGVLQ